MKQRLRIALVKQDVYNDLYVAKPFDNSFYAKSPARSGPMGLFTEFDADFFIVKQDNAEECNIWKQKIIAPAHQTIEEWNAVPSKYEHMGISQGECSIPVGDIVFEKYDIVISFDIAVPQRIVRLHPQALWCYYITEPPMKAYSQSQLKPLYGYDLFLNQRFRHLSELAWDPSSLPSSHEIDFPYTLTGSNTYSELFGFSSENGSPQKLRIAIPKYVRRLMDDAMFAHLSERYYVNILGGYNVDFLRSLCESDVYLRLGNTPKFGNEAIEAVAAGTVFLSSTRGWRNRVFNVPSSTINPYESISEQFDEALVLLKRLEESPNLMFCIKSAQQEILDDLCFNQPISRLMQAFWSKRLS